MHTLRLEHFPSPSMRANFIAACCLATLSKAIAQVPQTTMTQAGFTGLAITPNAHLLGWGRAEFAYDNQLPGNVRDPSGHNYVLGFGFLPNLEFAGRLAANSPQNGSCFVAPGCGTRDLSASAKVGIGLDTAGRFRVAAGVTDIGGNVTFFRSYYGVGTFNQGPWEASAGFARRSGRGVGGSKSPLDGPFAAAAWQPLPWVRGQIEYTDKNAWAGVRLFAPQSWLPEGWSAHIGANKRLTDTNLTRGAWWSAGISIPLYKVPALPGVGAPAPLPALAPTQLPLPAYEARTPAPAVQPPQQAIPRPTLTDDRLTELAAALRGKGLEDLWIGRMADGSVAVRANNASYNWNSVDALGAALGVIAGTLGDYGVAYRLVLTQRQIPLVAVTGQTDCLRQWIQSDSASCPGGELSTPGTGDLDRMHAGATWIVRRASPSWETVRVSLTPVLRTNIGSEVGVLDYSLGANVGVLLPLWSGASVETRLDVPLANSDDFREGGVFSNRRVRSQVERVAFTQTMRLPLERYLAPGNDLSVARWGLASVTAQASVGRFGGSFDGVHGQVRWEPGNGRHRVTAQAGWLENARFGEPTAAGPRTARPALLSYRYNVAPTRTYLEATGGNFFNNDVGFQLGVRQWFSDVAVQVYFRRSRFEGSPARQFVGLEISVPIGPRRDMTPLGHVQVTGTPRFTHAIETTVRENGGNVVRTGFGVSPPVPQLESTFNSDRASLLYFEDNVRRIRDAAR